MAKEDCDGTNSTLFTAHYHYDGIIVGKRKLKYRGGKCATIDYVNPDTFSLLELHNMLNLTEEKGKGGHYVFAYNVPGVDRHLKLIDSDADAFALTQRLGPKREVNIYADRTPPLEVILTPTKKKKHKAVPIVDIDGTSSIVPVGEYAGVGVDIDEEGVAGGGEEGVSVDEDDGLHVGGDVEEGVSVGGEEGVDIDEQHATRVDIEDNVGDVNTEEDNVGEVNTEEVIAGQVNTEGSNGGEEHTEEDNAGERAAGGDIEGVEADGGDIEGVEADGGDIEGVEADGGDIEGVEADGGEEGVEVIDKEEKHGAGVDTEGVHEGVDVNEAVHVGGDDGVDEAVHADVEDVDQGVQDSGIDTGLGWVQNRTGADTGLGGEADGVRARGASVSLEDLDDSFFDDIDMSQFDLNREPQEGSGRNESEDGSYEPVASSDSSDSSEGSDASVDVDSGTSTEEEFNSSDNLTSPGESDEDCTTRRRKKSRLPKLRRFRTPTGLRFIELQVGLQFGSSAQFKETVKEYGIKQQRNIYCVKNDKLRCSFKCHSESCNWYIYASCIGSAPNWTIKTFRDDHQCVPTNKNSSVSSRWLAKQYLYRWQADTDWSIRSLIADVSKEYLVKITRPKAYRARSRAMNLILGDDRIQYRRLRQYCHEILRTNPGSTMIVQCDERVFKRVYVCLKALKDGFKSGCRPVLVMDGCFLKGAFGGQLLVAVAVDANDQMYPLAWAVVESENRDSWTWFLQLLGDDIDIQNQRAFTWMSDKQKGLVPALLSLFPNSEHRFCARHLYANMKKTFPGREEHNLYWACARSTWVEQFNYYMDQMKQCNRAAYDWLQERPPSQWSRAHYDTETKCSMQTSNLAECFNAVILDYRSKGIISLLEGIRDQTVRRIVKKRIEVDKWDQRICPAIQKKLAKIIVKAGQCRVLQSGGPKYQVTEGQNQYVVDMEERECACRAWQLSGVPCCHAVSTIFLMGRHPVDYVSDCFLVATQKSIYSHIINPINGYRMWPSNPFPPVEAPPELKVRGRRQTARRKDRSELLQPPTAVSSGTKLSKAYSIQKCSKCKGTGHNKRRCTGEAGSSSTVDDPTAPVQGQQNDPTAPTPVQGQQNHPTAAAPAQGQQDGTYTQIPLRRAGIGNAGVQSDGSVIYCVDRRRDRMHRNVVPTATTPSFFSSQNSITSPHNSWVRTENMQQYKEATHASASTGSKKRKLPDSWLHNAKARKLDVHRRLANRNSAATAHGGAAAAAGSGNTVVNINISVGVVTGSCVGNSGSAAAATGGSQSSAAGNEPSAKHATP